MPDSWNNSNPVNLETLFRQILDYRRVPKVNVTGLNRHKVDILVRNSDELDFSSTKKEAL